ncbi:hypothetical protein EON67_12075 [archaeon]|nr:MAG: hypothetical protein EON67_12075 [archaeon]
MAGCARCCTRAVVPLQTQIACVSNILAWFCCWLMWICTWLHQWHPIISTSFSVHSRAHARVCERVHEHACVLPS